MADLIDLSPQKPTLVNKPWGNYTVMDDYDNVKTKTLVIKNGHQISLQSHALRKERWAVMGGIGEFHFGESPDKLNVGIIGQGSVLEISPGVLHRVKAILGDLIIFEVQIGDNRESDIVRYKDDYGRTTGSGDPVI